MRRAERLAWRWKISFVSCRLDKDYVEILSYVTMWCPVCCNGEVGYNIKAVFCLMWCYQSTRQAFDKLTHTLILHSAFTLNWTLLLNSFISYEWLAYSCARHLGGGWVQGASTPWCQEVRTPALTAWIMYVRGFFDRDRVKPPWRFAPDPTEHFRP